MRYLPEDEIESDDVCRYQGIYLTNFNTLNELGANFLYNRWLTCESKLYLGHLPNLHKIGSYFLEHFENFSIDFNKMPNLKEIGSNFMMCHKMTSVDMSPLSNLLSVGDNFMNTYQKSSWGYEKFPFRATRLVLPKNIDKNSNVYEKITEHMTVIENRDESGLKLGKMTDYSTKKKLKADAIARNHFSINGD